MRRMISFNLIYDDNYPGIDSGIGDIGTQVSTGVDLSNANGTLSITGLVLTKGL